MPLRPEEQKLWAAPTAGRLLNPILCTHIHSLIANLDTCSNNW